MAISRPSLTLSVLLYAFLSSVQALAEPVDFTLPDLTGKSHKLSDHRGKWVLVNYWATWCPPCLDEIPELELFHSKHKDQDAVVIGVAMDEIDNAGLGAFVEDQFISYPILRTDPYGRGELGSVPGLPTSFLVSPSGELVARQVGPVTANAIETFMRSHPDPGAESQP